jgi:hypothetical protein
MATADKDIYLQLLEEAIRGSMFGIRLGDVDTRRSRRGEPKDDHVYPNIEQRHPVELHYDDDGVIGLIYVEIPDDLIFGLDDAVPDAPPLVPTPDPHLSTTQVGAARIDVDPRTRRIRSFSVWPSP